MVGTIVEDFAIELGLDLTRYQPKTVYVSDSRVLRWDEVVIDFNAKLCGEVHEAEWGRVCDVRSGLGLYVSNWVLVMFLPSSYGCKARSRHIVFSIASCELS